MYRSLLNMIGISRVLDTTEARTRIETKTERIGRKARQMRNGYTNAQIKQRNQIKNQMRTKHK